MIKTVFFDVDGTLFSHSRNCVPADTLKAVSDLREKGIKAVIATGRSMMELDHMLGPMEFDGYITLNGQVILDKDRNILFSHPLSANAQKTIISLFNDKKISLHLVESDTIYANFLNVEVIKVLKAVCSEVPPVKEYSGRTIYMVKAFATPAYLRSEILPQLSDCSLTCWHHDAGDIMPADGGKDKGILKYCEISSTDLKECASIGDGENDIPMLKLTAVGVAMGNSRDEVKKAADLVAPKIDEGGLRQALVMLRVL